MNPLRTYVENAFERHVDPEPLAMLQPVDGRGAVLVDREVLDDYETGDIVTSPRSIAAGPDDLADLEDWR